MKSEEFRRVIHERILCDDEWTYGIEQCWKKEIALLTEDEASTIEFLKNECTADEFSWISEVLEEVIEIIPSRELLRAYKNLMCKFPEECVKYNIAGSIEEAEAIFNLEEEHGESS